MTPEQKRLFTMLEELVGIFREHDLTYYVAGGTTLGAVRHGGFIPWDDDIDIMMPYDDWRALVEIARTGGLPENRVLNCLELDEDYPHVFGRYTDTTSCAIHYNQLLGGTPEGFIIDIFILDPVSDALVGFDRHRKLLSLYNDLANDFGYSYPMSQDKALLKQYSRRVKFEGRRAVLSELAAELSSGDPEACDYLVMRWAAAPRLFKKELFAFTRYEQFEGLSVSVPGRCADYLVQHYGDDWMYVPGHGGRITHDAITFLDVDYATVQADYLPFVNVERARKAFLNRRAYHIDNMYSLKRVDDMTARVLAAFAREETLKRAHEYGVDSQRYDECEKDTLEWVFAEFYRVQNLPELVGREEYLTINRYYNPICIDIGDDLLAIALFNLLDTNRVGQAARILRAFERSSSSLSPSLREVHDWLELIRLPPSLSDIGLKHEAIDLSAFVLDKRPENFSNRVFHLEELYAAGSISELDSIAHEGASCFPEAGEFEKFQVDASYENANGDEAWLDAFAGYEKALVKTTHRGIANDVQLKADMHPELVGEGLSSLLAGSCEEQRQLVPASSVSYDVEGVRRKTERLLVELSDICNRHGIPHFLGCTSARLAFVFGGNVPGVPMLDLYVPADRFDVLARVLEGECADNRAIDYWGTNKNHLGYQLDYVDKTTTYLQIDEGFNVAAHGVKVAVTPIRSYTVGMRAKLLDVLETGWELNGYKLTKKVSGKRLASAGAARVGMVFGRGRLAHGLFNGLTREYSGRFEHGSKVFLRLPYGKLLTCEASHFIDSETVEFCGRSFAVASGMGELLASWIGPNWKRETLETKLDMKNLLLSSDLPYETFISQLEREGCPVDSLFALMKRIRLSMLPLANDLRIRNRVMAIAERSADRKRCFDYLAGHDEAISQLLEDGEFDRLGEILKPYEDKAIEYLQKGLGLCPSKKYLSALCRLWRKRGDAERADRLEALVPELHYRPLGGAD